MEILRVNNLLNKIVVGTAQFGLDYGINNKSGKVPQDEVYKILDLAKENGIDFIDTAQAYGNSENVLGNYQRDRNTSLKIISKLQDCAPDKVEVKVQESLEKLFMKNLYGILLHSFDTYIKNPEIYFKITSLKKEGLVDKVGFSLYYPDQLVKILDDEIEIDIVQIPYNFFDRRFEKYFPILKEKNIEIHVRSIFLQGLFFMQPKNLPLKLKEFSEYLTLMKELSLKLRVNIHELALIFVISNSLIDKVVLGVDNVNQIKEIINAVKDKSKLELVSSQKDTFAKLEVKNESILIPSNWN